MSIAQVFNYFVYTGLQRGTSPQTLNLQKGLPPPTLSLYMRHPPLQTHCHLIPAGHVPGLQENYRFRNRLSEQGRFSSNRKILHLEPSCRSSDIFHLGTWLAFEAVFGPCEATYSYSTCPHGHNSPAGASNTPYAIPEKNLGEEAEDGHKSMTQECYCFSPKVHLP